LPSAQSRRPSRRRRATAALPALAAAALLTALAGCGSSHSSGTAADPAAAVPASAAVYAAADVRPSGAEKAAATSVAKALTHQSDPYLRLLLALQTPGSPTLNFSRDVAPWLGPHAGIFLSSASSAGALLSIVQQGLLGGGSPSPTFLFSAGGAQGAVVLDTSDAGKARTFLHTQAQHAGAHATSYRGVSYQTTSAGTAFGLVGRFAVIGSESGIRSVIDTRLGGPALAHAGGYARLLGSAPAGALAHIYANGASGSPATQTATPGLMQLLAGARETNISIVPSTSSIALDADSLKGGSATTPGGLLSAASGGAQAFSALPGDAWLALGLGDVGTSLGSDVQGLQTLASLGSALGGSGPEAPSSSPLSIKGLLEGLLTPLGMLAANTAQARHDFTGWMGSAGVFASGGSLLELKAAVVISSKDPARSRAAVAKLAALLRRAGDSVQPLSSPGAEAGVAAHVTGLPVVLDIADGRDSTGGTKFVLGLGEASVGAALNPQSTLAGAASTKAAAATLGEGIQPNLTANFPTLLSLLEGVGLTEDASISKLLPYLRAATTLSGGGRVIGGDVERVRLVLGLRQSAG
jgi:Protein of unknown function (DUF3352)